MDPTKHAGPNGQNQLTVAAFLSHMSSRVDARKLRHLEQILTNVVEGTLKEQILDDPVVLRRAMVDYLKHRGASAGIIQAHEQFFMGLVRRAALDGLLPAPPEGPWTRRWQSVIDAATSQTRTRASLRMLAGWATARGLEPTNVRTQLASWVSESAVADEMAAAVHRVLAEWEGLELKGTVGSLSSDPVLAERLRRKAQNGTVRSAD